MAFNNDVGVSEVFAKFYMQVMGKETSGFTELEVFYSIGIAFGILVFFNHVGRKKITPDPTPLQVEMRKYENDIDTTFIENSSRGEEAISMWVNHVILALMGLFAGFAVSAGTFAFLIAIGVIPRLIGKSNTARAVFSYETMILLGGVVGNIISTYSDMSMPAGRILLILFGFCAGIFCGLHCRFFSRDHQYISHCVPAL